MITIIMKHRIRLYAKSYFTNENFIPLSVLIIFASMKPNYTQAKTIQVLFSYLQISIIIKLHFRCSTNTLFMQHGKTQS